MGDASQQQGLGRVVQIFNRQFLELRRRPATGLPTGAALPTIVANTIAAKPIAAKTIATRSTVQFNAAMADQAHSVT
jgi:hypothetical protein